MGKPFMSRVETISISFKLIINMIKMMSLKNNIIAVIGSGPGGLTFARLL